MDFVRVMKTIREIDKDHNGFVTDTELDDILKIHYPNDFKNKDLNIFMKKFRSIENKVLVDYQKIKEHVILGLR